MVFTVLRTKMKTKIRSEGMPQNTNNFPHIIKYELLVPRSFDAKSMLSSLATNLMSRGYIGDSGSSQVISLNLTNLLVLVLLKALIFAAGSIGAGTWKGGYARSNDGEERLITDEEIVLFLSYLTGTLTFKVHLINLFLLQNLNEINYLYTYCI